MSRRDLMQDRQVGRPAGAAQAPPVADPEAVVEPAGLAADEAFDPVVRLRLVTGPPAVVAVIADVLDVIRDAAAPPDPWCRGRGARALVAAQVGPRLAVDQGTDDPADAAGIDVLEPPPAEDARRRVDVGLVADREVGDLTSRERVRQLDHAELLIVSRSVMAGGKAIRPTGGVVVGDRAGGCLRQPSQFLDQPGPVVRDQVAEHQPELFQSQATQRDATGLDARGHDHVAGVVVMIAPEDRPLAGMRPEGLEMLFQSQHVVRGPGRGSRRS